MKYLFPALMIVISILSQVYSGKTLTFKKRDPSTFKKLDRSSAKQSKSLRASNSEVSRKKFRIVSKATKAATLTSAAPSGVVKSYNSTQEYLDAKSRPPRVSSPRVDTPSNRIDHIAGVNPIYDDYAEIGPFGDGGKARYASFGWGNDIGQTALCPETGDIYVADADIGRIRKISKHSGIITTVAGGGDGDGDGDEATELSLDWAKGVAVSKKSFYFTDLRWGSTVVYKVKKSSGKAKVIAGGGSRNIYNSPLGDDATEYHLGWVYSVAVGPNGVVYFPAEDDWWQGIYFVKHGKLQLLTNDYPGYIRELTVAPGNTPSGNVYFTLPGEDSIGVVDIDANSIAVYEAIHDNEDYLYFYPTSITTSPSGDVYFLEDETGSIWRINVNNGNSADLVWVNAVSSDNDWDHGHAVHTETINVDSDGNLIIGTHFHSDDPFYQIYKVNAPIHFNPFNYDFYFDFNSNLGP